MLRGDFVDAVNNEQKTLFIDVVAAPIKQLGKILRCAALAQRGNFLVTAVKKLVFLIGQQAVSHAKEEIALAADADTAAIVAAGEGIADLEALVGRIGGFAIEGAGKGGFTHAALHFEQQRSFGDARAARVHAFHQPVAQIGGMLEVRGFIEFVYRRAHFGCDDFTCHP